MARNSLSSEASVNNCESISEQSFQVPKSWFISEVDQFPNEVLGRGSFGTVCKGDWLGSKVAIKTLHRVFFETTISETQRNAVLRTFGRELNILFQLKHPNIVTFYGVYDTEGQGTLTLGPGTCLVQELLYCSLSVRNRAEPRLDLRQVVDISLGIVSGLRYLHERSEPIVHRDLASKNILLSQYGIPKISDLGVAKVLSSAQNFTQHSRQPGTDLYMPPEVKIEGVGYNYLVDVYSFGVILMEISIGRDPSATEAFRMSHSAGSGLHVVPETERRRSDLILLENTSIKSLVLCCLARRDDRPAAKSVYLQLKKIQRLNEYTNLPVIPVIVTTPSYSSTPDTSRLEHQVRSLRTENARIQMQLQRLTSFPLSHHHHDAEYLQQRQLRSTSDQLCNTSFPLVEREKVKFYEATLRSKDVEVHGLRQKLLSLEQQLSKTSLSSPSLPNGSSSSSEYPPAPRGYLARGVLPEENPATYQSSTYQQPFMTLSSSSSLSSSLSSDTDMKQMKRQLEKYKTLSVELDLKLKDAKLELSQYATRQTSTDMQARFEVDALQAENRMLRSELDRAVRDNTRLQHESTFSCRQTNMY